MEGITGLVDAIDVQPGGADYERGRVMMTEDVNAAVRGALAAGATAVTVNDAHGPMRNLLPGLIHPAAALIRRPAKRMGMMEGLAGGFAAAVCIGYHARAGALGVLGHSFMGHEIATGACSPTARSTEDDPGGTRRGRGRHSAIERGQVLRRPGDHDGERGRISAEMARKAVRTRP